jgi:hypothetical protein
VFFTRSDNEVAARRIEMEDPVHSEPPLTGGNPR